jgi:chromate transport protein ChrA
MVAVFALLGPNHVLWRVGLFFSKLAVVTFGGAYAVLAYMAQQAVTASIGCLPPKWPMGWGWPKPRRGR